MSWRQASSIPGPGASPNPSGHVKTVEEVQMSPTEASIQALQMFTHPVPMFLLAVVLGSWALATLTYAMKHGSRIDQQSKEDINETTK